MKKCEECPDKATRLVEVRVFSTELELGFKGRKVTLPIASQVEYYERKLCTKDAERFMRDRDVGAGDKPGAENGPGA